VDALMFAWTLMSAHGHGARLRGRVNMSTDGKNPSAGKTASAR
jgi:hypothetical protein